MHEAVGVCGLYCGYKIKAKLRVNTYGFLVAMPDTWCTEAQCLGTHQLNETQRMKMKDYQHEYTTTLNGAAVTVVIDVTWYRDDDAKEGQWEASFSLDSVWFDGTDVLPILDVNTQMALEMEATRAIEDDQE